MVQESINLQLRKGISDFGSNKFVSPGRMVEALFSCRFWMSDSLPGVRGLGFRVLGFRVETQAPNPKA